MLKNYFKIAWRNITKRKFYSFLNIAGLSIGVLFTFLITAYVWNELQVNKRLRNASQHYFLRSIWKDPNQGVEITSIGPLSKRLKEEYPSLVTNFYRWDGITSVVSNGNKHFRENIQLGDSTLLPMFGFKLLHGDERTALHHPFSVVIAKEIAIKYFGRSEVVGETITIQSFSGSEKPFTVTGILQSLPENSVTALNDENHNTIYIPTNTFAYFGRFDFEAWANIYIPSYIEVKPGVTAKDLEIPIRQLLNQHAPDFVKQNLTVQPIRLVDYYLQKDNALVKRMLSALSFVGLFILLMAVVNFINISISSSSSRIREIGVRKVLGGLKRQIVLQFLTESLILVLFATTIAICLYPVFQSLFAELVGKPIPNLSSFPVYFIGLPIALVLVVGLLAGLYPAFLLSSLRSVDSLKGQLKTIRENVWLRKSLAGFQFSIAAVVIIIAVIVSQQVSYFFSKRLGYSKEFIVSSQVPRDWTPDGVRKIETVRNEFARMPEVANVTVSYEIPNGMNGTQPPVYKYGTDSTSAISMQSMVTDEYYLDTYQISMQSGSFFKASGGFDSSKVILNEAASKALGFTSHEIAIGQQLRIPNDPVIYTVQGVVRDFHFDSMLQMIQPFIFFHPRRTNTYRYLSFRLKPGRVGSSIAAIERKWSTLLPGSSFEYNFMDDVLKKLYRTEIQLQKASFTATVLSIVIVLLGVIGLVSLSIKKRTKEIGIRKVLGSSVAGIIGLFMRDFIIVIIFAGVVASPLAYLVMKGWLDNYAYRIPITAQPFLLSIVGLAVVTSTLIILQTRRAANANPVKSLRTE